MYFFFSSYQNNMGFINFIKSNNETITHRPPIKYPLSTYIQYSGVLRLLRNITHYCYPKVSFLRHQEQTSRWKIALALSFSLQRFAMQMTVVID